MTSEDQRYALIFPVSFTHDCPHRLLPAVPDDRATDGQEGIPYAFSSNFLWCNASTDKEMQPGSNGALDTRAIADKPFPSAPVAGPSKPVDFVGPKLSSMDKSPSKRKRPEIKKKRNSSFAAQKTKETVILAAAKPKRKVGGKRKEGEPALACFWSMINSPCK